MTERIEEIKEIKLKFLLNELCSTTEQKIRKKVYGSSKVLSELGIVEFIPNDSYLVFFTEKIEPTVDFVTGLFNKVFSQNNFSVKKEAMAMVIDHGSKNLHILLCNIIHPESDCPTFKIDGLISPPSRQLLRDLARGYGSVAMLLPDLKKEISVSVVDVYKNMGLALKEITEYAEKQKMKFQILKISFLGNEVTLVTE